MFYPMKSARILLTLTALGCSLFFAGCRVRDVREATIRAEGMRTEADLAKIEKALRRLPDGPLTNRPGEQEQCLKILEADFAKETLRIRYDSMKVGIANLESVLSEAGYGTEKFPARTTPGTTSRP